MCQFQRIPFDAALVLREFPPPYSLETLLHAASRLGFDGGARDASPRSIRPIGTPCIVFAAGDAGTGRCGGAPRPVPATHRLAVVTRATDDELQTDRAGSRRPGNR